MRKPVKSQLKRRRNTNPNGSNENATTSDQPLISILPAPTAPTPQAPQTSSIPPISEDQTEGRKRKRTQFYGFTEANISPTSSWASTSSAKPKKRRTKKNKKGLTTENSSVALIQDAEQSRIPSPPRPDLQLGQTSSPDSRIGYYDYEQEREISVWDAENEI